MKRLCTIAALAWAANLLTHLLVLRELVERKARQPITAGPFGTGGVPSL